MRLWRVMGKMTKITKIIDRTPREQLARLLFWSRVSDNVGSNAPEILTACEEAADAILDSAWLIKHDAEIIFKAKMEQAIVDGEIVRNSIDEWLSDYQINLKVRPLVDVVIEDIQNQRQE